MDTQENIKFEHTNTCTCTYYSEELDEYVESGDCWGDCYDSMIEDMENITSHLFSANETNWWRVSNLRLWNGDVSGYFRADTVAQLITGMTVRSEWIMRGEIFDDHIEYSLSHHDAPMGSSTRLDIVSEEEVEEKGLY